MIKFPALTQVTQSSCESFIVGLFQTMSWWPLRAGPVLHQVAQGLICPHGHLFGWLLPPQWWLWAPFQLPHVQFCMAPISPALLILPGCTGSCHLTNKTSHFVCLGHQEVPISPFLQLIEVLDHPHFLTTWYQHQPLVGCDISTSPVCSLALPSPTDVFSCLRRSPDSRIRMRAQSAVMWCHPEPLLTSVGWVA